MFEAVRLARDGRPTGAKRTTPCTSVLVRPKVDVMVTQTVAATLAAMEAATQIPIVMTGTPDPEARGIVTSFARPGGNVTGVTARPGKNA
jgi:putative ABC transport system substrate-binding protein